MCSFCKLNKFVRMPIFSWPLPFPPSSRPCVSVSRVLCDLFLVDVSPFQWCASDLSVFAWIWIYRHRWRQVFSNRVNQVVAMHHLRRRVEERLVYIVLSRALVTIGKPMELRSSFKILGTQLTGDFLLVYLILWPFLYRTILPLMWCFAFTGKTCARSRQI